MVSKNIAAANRRIENERGHTFFKINDWFLFGVILAVYLLLTFLLNQYILNDKIFYRSYADQLTLPGIKNFLDIQEKYRWLSYTLIPLIIALKVSYAAVCISIGAVLSNVKFKFDTIFKTALLAEIVFILARVLYLINLSFHFETLTFETAPNHYPLTILSYFGTENVVQWLQYPLQTLNLFEVAYMVVIAWLLSKHWKDDFMESLAVVVPSYATGLLLWLIFVTFITLQVS